MELEDLTDSWTEDNRAIKEELSQSFVEHRAAFVTKKGEQVANILWDFEDLPIPDNFKDRCTPKEWDAITRLITLSVIQIEIQLAEGKQWRNNSL